MRGLDDTEREVLRRASVPMELRPSVDPISDALRPALHRLLARSLVAKTQHPTLRGWYRGVATPTGRFVLRLDAAVRES